MDSIVVDIHEDYVFSTASTDDIEEIANLKVYSFIDKYTWCCATIPGGLKASVSGYKKQSFALPQCGLVREKASGKLVGCCQVKLENQPGDPSFPSWANHLCKKGEAHVEFICVDESCRGKGLGKTLMKWADDFAKSKGADRISLEVVCSNKRAKALYERIGYKTTRTPDCIEIGITYVVAGIPGAYVMEKKY